MALDVDSVKVVGLKELRKELKKLDERGLLDDLKDANYEVAGLVVSDSQSHAAGRQASKAAQSLKPSRTAAKAQVSSTLAWFAGAEFGSDLYKQFKPHRGTAGYFLFPTIRDDEERIIDIYGDAIEKIASKAFPD